MKLSIEEARARLQQAVQNLAEPILRASEIMELAAEGESRVRELERTVQALTTKIDERKALLDGMDVKIAGRVRACDEAIAAKHSAAELELHTITAKMTDVKWQLDEVEKSTRAKIASLHADMEAKQKEHDVFVGKMDMAIGMKQGEFDNLRKSIAELVRKHGLHAHA